MSEGQPAILYRGQIIKTEQALSSERERWIGERSDRAGRKDTLSHQGCAVSTQAAWLLSCRSDPAPDSFPPGDMLNNGPWNSSPQDSSLILMVPHINLKCIYNFISVRSRWLKWLFKTLGGTVDFMVMLHQLYKRLAWEEGAESCDSRKPPWVEGFPCTWVYRHDGAMEKKEEVHVIEKMPILCNQNLFYHKEQMEVISIGSPKL